MINNYDFTRVPSADSLTADPEIYAPNGERINPNSNRYKIDGIWYHGNGLRDDVRSPKEIRSLYAVTLSALSLVALTACATLPQNIEGLVGQSTIAPANAPLPPNAGIQGLNGIIVNESSK